MATIPMPTVTSYSVTASGKTGIFVVMRLSNLVPNETYNFYIEYYVSGYPNDATRIDFLNYKPTATTATFTQSITGLLPNTHYQAKFAYHQSGTTTKVLGNMHAKTDDLTGTFAYTQKTASVITAELSGLSEIEYATKVLLWYKRGIDDEWKLGKTVEIDANTTKTVSHMFTGLNASTDYNFRADIIRADNDAVLKKFSLNVRTLVYTGGGESVAPSIKKIIAVPNTGRLYIKAETSAPLKSNLSVHLWESSDGNTYMNLMALPSTLDTVLNRTAGQSYWYRLSIIDGNNNSYNLTEPIRVEYPSYVWTNKVAGDPLAVTATEVREMADSLLIARDFQINAVNHVIFDIVDELADNGVERMRGIMPDIEAGKPLDDEVINAVVYLASALMYGSEQEVDNSYRANKVTEGNAITAERVNAVINAVKRALNNMRPV